MHGTMNVKKKALSAIKTQNIHKHKITIWLNKTKGAIGLSHDGDYWLHTKR